LVWTGQPPGEVEPVDHRVVNTVGERGTTSPFLLNPNSCTGR